MIEIENSRVLVICNVDIFDLGDFLDTLYVIYVAHQSISDQPYVLSLKFILMRWSMRPYIKQKKRSRLES